MGLKMINIPLLTNQSTNEIVVLMQGNRLSPRLKEGEHVTFYTDVSPELETCVLTASGNNLNIEIYNGTQTNIIGGEISRYMKRTKVDFSNVIKLNWCNFTLSPLPSISLIN